MRLYAPGRIMPEKRRGKEKPSLGISQLCAQVINTKEGGHEADRSCVSS